MSFVDETGDITRNYDGGSLAALSPPSRSQRSPTRSDSTSSVAISNLVSPGSISPEPRDSTVHSPAEEELPLELEPVFHRQRTGSRGMPLQDLLTGTSPPPRKEPGESSCLASLYLDRTTWPLQDPQDAKLLQHYITDVAGWVCTHALRTGRMELIPGEQYDIHNKSNHFQTTVPLLSATCPMLSHAVFALSAKHLSKTTDFNPHITNHYLNFCIPIYTAALASPALALDDAFIATTVILRAIEVRSCFLPFEPC